MSSFRVYTISGTRYGIGTWTKGKYTPGTSSSIQFTASVQPLSGREKLTLPEGVREKVEYKLYTDFQLLTVDEKTSKNADRVVLFGKTYEIVKVEIWQNKVIPHYKALASLIDA